MVAYNTIKVGDVLYDCHTYGMGNTVMRAMGVWEVKIVALERNGAEVRWNGNRPERWHMNRLDKLRRSPPEWVSNPIDGARCYFCQAKRRDGAHRDDCEHPKAVAARKKVANAR